MSIIITVMAGFKEEQLVIVGLPENKWNPQTIFRCFHLKNHGV
jgi:hypothetical protein